MEKTKISIKRLSCILGCAAKCKIELDGICVGKVANGKTVEFWADNGVHTLSIYWGFKKTTIEINIHEDDEIISLIAKLNISKDRLDFYSAGKKLLSTNSTNDATVTMLKQKSNINFPQRDRIVLVSAVAVAFLCVAGILLENNSTVNKNNSVISTQNTNMSEENHKHEWKEELCEKPLICLTCGEIKEEVLGHTTDCGVCTRCNKELRKKSPVTILNWRYNIDYVGGVEWNFKIKNNTDKQIKYVTLQWDCYNAVGDLIYDDISWKSYVRIRFTGPLDAYATSTTKRNTDKFYNYNLKSYKMTEIIVEYMDGTKEEVTQYHDDILG